jgi:hypothetical protein
MLIATSIILTTRFNVVITVKLVSINNNRDADESKNKGLLIMLVHDIDNHLSAYKGANTTESDFNICRINPM